MVKHWCSTHSLNLLILLGTKHSLLEFSLSSKDHDCSSGAQIFLHRLVRHSGPRNLSFLAMSGAWGWHDDVGIGYLQFVPAENQLGLRHLPSPGAVKNDAGMQAMKCHTVLYLISDWLSPGRLRIVVALERSWKGTGRWGWALHCSVEQTHITLMCFQMCIYLEKSVRNRNALYHIRQAELR